ncbi:hypothetical protein HGA34_01800 [Candidatus Falkowbacteria bacterium]|nr:hypothetical protein [Candidatus Falkowbacteria bacterium]
MSRQGTVDGFEKKSKRQSGQEDHDTAKGKKKREKKAGSDEAAQFSESMAPEVEKIQHYNDRFESIERSVESYKNNFAEYLTQLESDDNSLGLKKDFYAKSMRLIDGLNGAETSLVDLKNKQLSEVEGSIHDLILSVGGIPPKAIEEYEKLSNDLEGLRDRIQSKIDEVGQLKQEDHDTLVKKGQEQGVADVQGVVEQARAEKRAEEAKAFFFEKVSAFRAEINRVRAIKAEDAADGEVVFMPPTSWGQIVSENTNNKELLKGLEELSAREPIEQLYSDLKVAVEQKNEELKGTENGLSVFDDAEEADLEGQLDAAGAAVAAGAELAEQKLKELEALKHNLKSLENKISARKNNGNQPKYNREARKEFEREAAKLRLQIAELENGLDPDQADEAAPVATAPDNLPIAEPALDDSLSPDSSSENSLADLEAQLDAQLNEEVERISQLPPKEQAGIVESMANFGFWLQKTKSNVFKRVTGSMTMGKDKDGSWNKYITEYAKTHERDAARAEKMLGQKKGVLGSAAGLGAMAGNLLRVGRIAYDVAGGSLRAFNPFRHVTAGALFVARGAEAGKEVRLGNKEVISKNRTLADVDFEAKMTKKERKELDKEMDRVAEEAWGLYEKAGIKDIRIADADGNIDQAKLAEAKQAMDKAYLEHLPEDLKKRLDRLDVSSSSLLGKVFLKGDIMWAVKSVNDDLEKIDNNQKLSSEEKTRKKQAIFASSEKLLKDFDRMIGDQGVVDWLAYAAKKTEWTGKAAANVMLIDSIRLMMQQLPEMAHAVNEWRLGPKSSLADVRKEATPLPAGAAAVNEKLINQLDGKAPAGQDGSSSANFGNRTTATGGRATGMAAGQPAPETVPAQPANAAEQPAAAKTKAPIQEQHASAKLKANSGADSVPAPAAPKNAAETAPFDPNKNFSESAVVHKGDGVIRVLKRQIVESPEEFGFKGDADDAAAVEKYASATAARAAAETGYWNRETGEEVRLSTKSIGRAAYVLERKGDGKFEVHEYFNNKPSQEMFQKEESHASGSAFEGNKHESYEYVHKGGVTGGNLAERGGGNGSQSENMPPEMRELLEQNEREASELAKDPHGIESEAVKLARARFNELADVVGKDGQGNLLIKDTEIAKVINFYDGISPDEKGKLVFWKEHLGELPTGSRAKEFFSLVDRAFTDKTKVEYNGHLLKAYTQMPEDMKALPVRAVGYLKVFGGAGYVDMARDGVRDMVGLGHLKELNFKLNMRDDGVVVAEGIKLPGAAREVDVYISHNKIGMMQPNSFLGFGRWDFWKGDLGIRNGQPMLELDAKNLRQLTHNIRNIDNLNRLNEQRFSGNEEYPQPKKEVAMVANEPEEEFAAKQAKTVPERPTEPTAAPKEKEAVQAERPVPEQEKIKAPAKDLRLSDIQRPKLGEERLKQLNYIMRDGNVSNIAKLNNGEAAQYLEARGVKIGGVEQKNLAVALDKIRNSRNLTGAELRSSRVLSNILTVSMRDLASQNETVRGQAADKLQRLLGGNYRETSTIIFKGAREK